MKKSVLAATMALASTGLWAEGVSVTQLHLLYGTGFDHIIGDRVDDTMSTVTLEHFGTWKYGDNFFFLDAMNGDFESFGSPKKHTVYMEWDPRLGLSSLSGKSLAVGSLKEVYLSGQLNQGDGYQATLVGLGADLALPGFAVFGVNGYRKTDNFDLETFQLSLNWLALGSLSGVKWRAEGFLDWTEENLIYQPQFMVDLDLIDGVEPGTLYAGIEHYGYRADGGVSADVPQFMVKWIW